MTNTENYENNKPKKKLSGKEVFIYTTLILATIISIITVALDMWVINKYTVIVWQVCFLLYVIDELLRRLHPQD
ncbi:MAG: hypothetical protein IJ086_00670 [Clostridium sp.]|nr:hypothetical protein [Clostridium sp.]